MNIHKILIYSLIAALNLNDSALPPYSTRHCLRPPATRTTLCAGANSASSGERFLDTMITKEPPDNLKPKQKLMWRAAYLAARYFARQGAVQHPDEIFGRCFQMAIQQEKIRSKNSNLRPMETLTDWQLAQRIIHNLVNKLRAENKISGRLNRGSRPVRKVRISGREPSLPETAQLKTEAKELIEILLDKNPGLSDFLGARVISDLMPEEIDAKLRILAILSRLKGRQRAVIYLLYLENRSRDEAAFILNCSCQRIGHINDEAAEIARRIDFSRIQHMPERFLSIEEVRREVYKKYGERLKILGSYEDNIRAESMEMQPSTPEEDIKLFEEAVRSFPKGTEIEAKITRMFFIEGKNDKEIQNRLNLTVHHYTMKSFSARVYLDYYLQARGVLGFIVRKSKFIPRQHLGFLNLVRLCYKHNAPIVYSKSCVVYDKLRGETIDLVRLNSFDNYRNMPDGHAHIARDLKLAIEKGILRPGLPYIYFVRIGQSPSMYWPYMLAKKHGLTNKFSFKMTRMSEEKYFKILRELKDNPGSYRRVAGLRRLAKKYKIRPEGIWLCFDRNFREEMGWGSLRQVKLPETDGRTPDPGRILKAIAAAA